MNIEFKIGIIRHFRSQTRAAKPLGTDEPRLSRLIHGHCEPTAEERRRFAAVLGVDYFAPDGNPARAEDCTG
jgi:UDP-glucose 4-epimerase